MVGKFYDENEYFDRYLLRFNEYKLMALDMDDGNYERISEIYGFGQEKVKEVHSHFIMETRREAAEIISEYKGLDGLKKDLSVKIAFIGDSNTSDRLSYFRVIKEAFLLKGFENVDCIDAAISGDRTSHTVDNIYPRVISKKPDIASIMIGTNDMRKNKDLVGITATSIPEFERNYRYIIELLLLNNVKIILNTLAPFNNEKINATQGFFNWIYTDENRKEFNEIIRKLAAVYRLELNDMEAEFEKYCTEQLLWDDGLHFSQFGQRLVAAGLLPLIAKLMDAGIK